MKRKLPDVITSRRLTQIGACINGKLLFAETFPKTYRTGVRITLYNARRADDAHLNLGDLAVKLGLCESNCGLASCGCSVDLLPSEFMKLYRAAKKAQERQS